VTKILRLLRTTADTARATAQEAAATLLESQALREATAATQQAHERLKQLLESAESHLRPLQQLRPTRRGAAGDQRSAALALPPAAAHEINNPLEAIASLIYVLENEGTLSDKEREYLAIIKGEVGRIAEIAQQSLANYRKTPVRENIAVAEVIESVLDLYKPKFEAKGIAVIRENQFRGNIRAHSRQIREVFANLFLNATDAMNSHGRLRIRISEAREWSGQQRCGVRILVADNGRGIAPKHLDKIFEPSFTTKGERGNGIGLSVVQDVIRVHRGTIRVRSSVREGRSGTIFSIFLPGVTRVESAA
jgi:two-component system CheB/CheR fusion protein